MALGSSVDPVMALFVIYCSGVLSRIYLLMGKWVGFRLITRQRKMISFVCSAGCVHASPTTLKPFSQTD